jgi:hypothetical protein
MGITRSSQNGRGKARKGRAAHHKVACMLGEAGGGPEWPDFTGLKSWSEKKTCLITTIEGVLACFAR